MNSLVIGIFLLLLPMAFAGGLIYFMATGKGTKPLDNNKDDKEVKDDKTKKR
jgi:hypothetical protein